MSIKTVTFDTTNLTASPYHLTRCDYQKTPPREMNTYGLARERGGVVVHTEYAERIVTVDGVITGATRDIAETNEDTLKKIFSQTGKNLDIAHRGTTLRFRSATLVGYERVDDDFSTTRIKYRAQFLCPEGVGRDTSVTNYSRNNITAASDTESVTIEGSAYPLPVVTFDFDEAVGVTKAEFTVNGDKITIEQAFSAGDVVVIDTENKKITVNGAEVDYTGIFPRFILGVNSYTLTITSTSHKWDLDIDYHKTWL